MAHLKFRAFVLRVIPLGDADRLLSLLSHEHGLIKAYARGARRGKSPLRLATQDFVLSDFEIFSYKDRCQVDGAELVEPFLDLQEDITRLVCASHLAQVLHDGAEHDAQGSDLYRFWAYALQHLRQDLDPVLLTHAAQMRLLGLIGFAPRLDACVHCEKSLQPPYRFSVSTCGLVCERRDCRQKAGQSVPASPATKRCLEHCQQARIEKLFPFQLSAAARLEFIKLSRHYLEHQMEKPYKRLDMLSQLEDPLSDPKSL